MFFFLLKDFTWKRTYLPSARKPYWGHFLGLHPWYDPNLYKKQISNNEPVVDDEPFIVLPPDNTINTKDEAFKLDEEAETAAPTAKKIPTTTPTTPTTPRTPTTPTTTPTTLTTPLTTPTTLPPITTPLPTTPPTTPPTPQPAPPTPRPIPPPPARPQIIDIQSENPLLKRGTPPVPANINLNLEIGDNGETAEAEQHENVPMSPTPRVIYAQTLPAPAESTPQPSPQIIIAQMPAASEASPAGQQPQIVMAQPAQAQSQPQYALAPAPSPPPQPQYIIAPPPPVPAPPPQYIIASPPEPQPAPAPAPVIVPAPPPAPIMYQQPMVQSPPAPVYTPAVYLAEASPPRTVIATPSSQNFAAPPGQVTIAASPPAAITVSSSAPAAPMGGLNNMLMSNPVMGLPSLNPVSPLLLNNRLMTQGGSLYPGGMGSLQSPLMQSLGLPLPSYASPLNQQLQYPSSLMYPSPLSLPGIQQFPNVLSSIGQTGYDPLLYNGLTGMFANAIRSSMTQSQPNALASALALAATQAQARNQPPDLLTAALVQALAQNMQQGIQPISNDRLVQALSQALSQAQPSMRQIPNPAPAPAPPASSLPPPPNPPQRSGPPVPLYQVVPTVTRQDAPPRASRSNASRNEYSVNTVGKALANALIKAARKVASQNTRPGKRQHKGSRHRHHKADSDGRYDDDEHYNVRSFVPLLYAHSPDYRYEKLHRMINQWKGKDMIKYYAMFRTFWRRVVHPCYSRACFICQRCLE